MVSGTNLSRATKSTQGMAKKNKPTPICACGNGEPLFKGYCLECVSKLKTRFTTYLDKYAALKEESESFNTGDVEKANDKLALLKAKAE